MSFSSSQKTITISASTTTASGALTQNLASMFICVGNPTTATAFVATGEGSATATTADIFVLPGQEKIIQKPSHHNYVATILSTGTGNIYVSACGTPR